MGLAVLLIEDDASFAQFLARFLKKEEHDVEHASTGEQGLKIFRARSPDVVLLDIILPDTGGMQVLEQLRGIDPNAAVIVMTAHGSIDNAVEAMRLGALDFVTKPIDLEALSMKLAQAAQLLRMRSDLDYLIARQRRDGGLESFIGRCDKMCAVYDKIREVAKTDNTTVLVTGPSGTGKELVAKAVHSLSARSDKPLMQIDCTAIPLSLMESELFGHERGAFTGADRVKKGLLELADGGTLLLDEIGDMALDLQSKLLRVLQERKFRRVGGTRDLRFDVRVVAATNQDLDAMCATGRFRRDLLFRLKVFQVELPPLNERGDDVVELAEAFTQQYAQTFRKRIRGLDAEAARTLCAYDFPGNVRELRNIIEQAVILCKGETITAELVEVSGSKLSPHTVALADTREPGQAHEEEAAAPPCDPLSTARGNAGGAREPAARSNGGQSADVSGGGAQARRLLLDDLGDSPLVEAERELIRQALQRTGGNKKRAAELLGISRFALQRRIEKLATQMFGMELE